MCENLKWDSESELWIWNMHTIIDKVIALYPWNKEEKLAKLYSKSIEDIWFWGLVLSLSNSDIEVENFIKKELI